MVVSDSLAAVPLHDRVVEDEGAFPCTPQAELLLDELDPSLVDDAVVPLRVYDEPVKGTPVLVGDEGVSYPLDVLFPLTGHEPDHEPYQVVLLRLAEQGSEAPQQALQRRGNLRGEHATG